MGANLNVGGQFGYNFSVYYKVIIQSGYTTNLFQNHNIRKEGVRPELLFKKNWGGGEGAFMSHVDLKSI